VATLGLFSPELVPAAWFDPELDPLAWFDPTLIGAPKPSVDDVSVPVEAFVGVETLTFDVLDTVAFAQAFVGVETFAFVFAYDASVGVEAFVGVETLACDFSGSGVVVEAFVGEEAAAFAMAYDASVPVEAFVGVEVVTSTFYDAGVPVEVFVGVEDAAYVAAFDASVPVEAFVGVEDASFVFADDASVLVEAFVGVELVTSTFYDASVPVEVFVGAEGATFAVFDDVSVPINAFVGVESTTFDLFDDVSVPINAFVGVETVSTSGAFNDEAAFVVAYVPSEVASLAPIPPAPSASVPGGGGVPLEDYLIGDYTVGELRQILDGDTLLEEIVELPFRQETDEERETRYSGEAKFSALLQDIIGKQPPPKPKIEAKTWLPLLALGAFMLGAIVATASSSDSEEVAEGDAEPEDFSGEPPDGTDGEGSVELSDLGDLDEDELADALAFADEDDDLDDDVMVRVAPSPDELAEELAEERRAEGQDVLSSEAGRFFSGTWLDQAEFVQAPNPEDGELLFGEATLPTVEPEPLPVKSRKARAKRASASPKAPKAPKTRAKPRAK
jgi:hypothetical protein